MYIYIYIAFFFALGPIVHQAVVVPALLLSATPVKHIDPDHSSPPAFLSSANLIKSGSVNFKMSPDQEIYDVPTVGGLRLLPHHLRRGAGQRSSQTA